MATDGNTFLTVGRFAAMAGVTIRTLRYYDEKGLLKPSGHRESGYRLYTMDDLFTLEQILTLKFLGLSLADIRKVLRRGEKELGSVLALQKQIVEDRQRHLDLVRQALERAGASVQDGRDMNWSDIIHIIKVVKMEQSKKWVEKFYTPEQLEKIQSGFTQEQIEQSQREWNELIDEVRANMDKDPASPELQPLVDRWQALINAFTKGDTGIRSSLNTLYATMDSAPAEFREYHNRNRDVYAFMQKAIDARGGNG